MGVQSLSELTINLLEVFGFFFELLIHFLALLSLSTKVFVLLASLFQNIFSHFHFIHELTAFHLQILKSRAQALLDNKLVLGLFVHLLERLLGLIQSSTELLALLFDF